MTVDLLSATSDAFFSLLSDAIDPADAKVATNFVEGDVPPLMTFGNISSEPFDDEHDDEQFERVSVQIAVLYLGTDRSELHRLMNLARAAIDRARPTADDIAFSPIRFTGQNASGPGEDGVTHAGSVEFEVLAQPT